MTKNVEIIYFAVIFTVQWRVCKYVMVDNWHCFNTLISCSMWQLDEDCVNPEGDELYWSHCESFEY